MPEPKTRIVAYLTPELRDSLAQVADDEASSESAIVTRALLMFFRERDRWNTHISQEEMMRVSREFIEASKEYRFGQGTQGFGPGEITSLVGSQTANPDQ